MTPEHATRRRRLGRHESRRETVPRERHGGGSVTQDRTLSRCGRGRGISMLGRFPSPRESRTPSAFLGDSDHPSQFCPGGPPPPCCRHPSGAGRCLRRPACFAAPSHPPFTPQMSRRLIHVPALRSHAPSRCHSQSHAAGLSGHTGVPSLLNNHRESLQQILAVRGGG